MNRPAADALREAWSRARRAGGARLRRGHGRTGTSLACLAVLDGCRPPRRSRTSGRTTDRQAVETPWQRRYVARFEAS
ncbi:hypothetical protein [Lentzea sp. E54]|uniref:hypothetical protein n=1 Tax=Lentzea xerophila TaxID=3435883 RepID=UPI003DA51159